MKSIIDRIFCLHKNVVDFVDMNDIPEENTIYTNIKDFRAPDFSVLVFRVKKLCLRCKEVLG